MPNRKKDVVDLFVSHLALADLAAVENEFDRATEAALEQMFDDDEEFSIFFADLTPEAQARYLRWRETSEEEENFEISPLAILCKAESEA